MKPDQEAILDLAQQSDVCWAARSAVYPAEVDSAAYSEVDSAVGDAVYSAVRLMVHSAVNSAVKGRIRHQ